MYYVFPFLPNNAKPSALSPLLYLVFLILLNIVLEYSLARLNSSLKPMECSLQAHLLADSAGQLDFSQISNCLQLFFGTFQYMLVLFATFGALCYPITLYSTMAHSQYIMKLDSWMIVPLLSEHHYWRAGTAASPRDK